MSVNFPSTPAVGDTLSVGSPPRTWRWNGEGWERFANAGQVVSVLLVFTPYVETTVAGLPAISNTIYTFTWVP